MGEEQIGNPAGAFAPLSGINVPPGVPEISYKVLYNSGATAIKQGGWVALDVAGTAGHINGIKAGAHGGVLHDVVGIAMESIAVGAYGKVCVEGPATALGSTAGITTGDQVTGSTASTDDQCVMTASTPLVGQVIGIALETAAAVVDTAVLVWVRSA